MNQAPSIDGGEGAPLLASSAVFVQLERKLDRKLEKMQMAIDRKLEKMVAIDSKLEKMQSVLVEKGLMPSDTLVQRV